MSKRLPVRTKLFYGIGDVGLSLTSTILGLYFLIYLTDVVGLEPGIAGIAIFVGRSWDYINDPIIGYLSDRTRTRWGRRRPFLLFGPIPYALTFVMLWWRPPVESAALLAAYYALAYIFYDSAATLIYMPYFALTPELTSDYDERTSLTSYRMFFSILGSLIAFPVPLMIINEFVPENVQRVLVMGIIFAVAAALPMYAVFFGTREREEYMEQESPKLLESLKIAFKNKPFVYGLIIFLATWVTVEIVQMTLMYFIKYVVHREPQAEIVMFTIFATAIAALPVWNFVARKWGKRWAYIFGISFWAIVQIVLIMLNAQTAFWFLLLICFLAGIGVAAAHVLPWAILPDAIEWGELQTGERNEGMFYSLVTLIHKVATSLALLGISQVLQFTGYVANAPQQTQGALTGIRIAIGPIPAVMLGIGILFAYLYPLDRKEHAEVVQQLEQRRAEAQEETALAR